ncbi:DUF5659 domain-containing protein [Clostridium botulinum]|uniref:DUF5659 domain-containing protein n=1 Tax=Clostridium botulinum TaxID=1491 RepID=UPI00046F5D45|nr:DUF5659 domain-containing protein [Clostridium botulinum]QDY18252.1 hypothetical protein CGQ27_14610 [Clostridium botulinum]
MENKMDTIEIVNRGKVSYLYCNDTFEEDIQLIERNGQEQYAFVFRNTEKLHKLLKEFDENVWLKRYNSCFKHVALALKKRKIEEI